MDHLSRFEELSTVLSRGETKMSVRLGRGLQIDLRVVSTKSFGAALQYFTGSKEHNIILRGMAKERGLLGGILESLSRFEAVITATPEGKALRVILARQGLSDDEILEAMRLLAREAGVFAEPAGATPLAGLRRSLGEGAIDPGERVVVLVTGSGLKDVQSAIRAAGRPHLIEPTPEALERAVGQAGLFV